jgi:hypothetical protein
LTISELIKLLQAELDKNGNIPVHFCSDHGGWIDGILDDPIIYTRHMSDHLEDGTIGNISITDFFQDSSSALQIGFDVRTY